MTRDERMAKLLDCVNAYAYGGLYDKGKHARTVIAEIAEDEQNGELREELLNGDRPTGD